MAAGEGGQKDLREEAEVLLSKARQLRLEIGDQNHSDNSKSSSLDASRRDQVSSPWLVNSVEEGEGYRLHIDIGREEGTWMERRWGASGRRIPLSVDVKFLKKAASEVESAKMVKDNFGGKSSESCVIATARAARLRDGFEKMDCNGGCYRIDSARGKSTVRFYLEVDGTKEDQGYGDVSVPAGLLYFSLPCFGGGISQLSSKEGIVTVRQLGWNTGWRREESRIVGTFYAKPIETARKKDRF